MNEENETQLNGKEGTKLSENKGGEKDVVGRGKEGKKNCSHPLAPKIFADFQEVGENVKKC